jgi:putative ABC transport system permease protein
MLRRLIAYARGLARRQEIESEAEEELAFHLEQATQANIDRGLSKAEARRAAIIELGGLTQTAERIRAVRTIGFSGLGRDLRHGMRALAANTGFTAAALLTIVLLVAGITTVFTALYAVLLRPLPYPEPDRLTFIESIQPGAFGTTVSLGDALTFRKLSRSFDLWGLYRVGYVTSVLDARKTPMPVQDMRVTPDVFPMLGVEMVLGRPLMREDATPSAPPVAVISFDLWQAVFGGSPDVLGRTVETRNKDPFTVVGVTRQGVNIPDDSYPYPILWRPATDAMGALRFTTIARLRPGTSLASGRAELALLAKRLQAEHPDTHRDRTTTATLLLDHVAGDYKRVLWLFFGAVLCVLLIGVGNLLSLQLARNGAREHEIRIRAALGASRLQLVRQLLVESTMLSTGGGILGLLVAWLSVRLILTMLPPRFPRADTIAIDGTVALFACGISLAVGLVVGSIPAWQASRRDLATRLNEGTRSATFGARRSRLQRVLITLETAAALVLLVCAALLGNSFQRLFTRDAGIDEDGLWAIKAGAPDPRGTGWNADAWRSMLEDVRRVPGVRSAALSVNAPEPLSGSDRLTGGILAEGSAIPARDGLRVSTRYVSDYYFSTLGTEILRGRPILAGDVAGSEEVVVINDLVAKTLWPGQDPIGKRLMWGGQALTVVGLIPTFRLVRVGADADYQVYSPCLQRRSQDYTAVFMVRAAPGDRRTPLAVKAALEAHDRRLDVRVSTMASVRWKQLAAERFRLAILSAFAASAVFLALVGAGGLVAYTVRLRRREIAVRVTLGAVSRHLLGIAIRQTIVPALSGLAFGIVAAGVATRLLASYLVEIKPIDPPTFGAAVGVLALAVLAACLIPAWQALRVDPVETLRAE